VLAGRNICLVDPENAMAREPFQPKQLLDARYVAGRAKIICADQLGNQLALREAYFALLRDQLKTLPREAIVLVILTGAAAFSGSPG
jgi:hypothetical protein